MMLSNSAASLVAVAAATVLLEAAERRVSTPIVTVISRGKVARDRQSNVGKQHLNTAVNKAVGRSKLCSRQILDHVCEN